MCIPTIKKLGEGKKLPLRVGGGVSGFPDMIELLHQA